MDTKHDQYLPQSANQCTGKNRTKIVKYCKHHANSIADPCCDRTNDNQRYRNSN